MRVEPLRRRGGFRAGLLCGILALAAGRVLVNGTAAADLVVSPLVRGDTSGRADAIVVLGAGVIGACEPNRSAVERVLLAARLWREGRAPVVLVTGGPPPGQPCPVAAVMARFAREVGVPADRLLVEEGSLSTRENAAASVPILRRLGARTLLIVTDRLHMWRAAASFAAFGFRVERASVPIYRGHHDNVSMLSAGLREYGAVAWYRLRGWMGKSG